MYLGTTVQPKLLNDHMCWTMSSHSYVKVVIETISNQLEKKSMKFNNRCNSPILQGYRTELYITQEIEADDITFYQEMMGMLKWAIELEQVDIYHEVSILSSYQVVPRRGHLE